MKPSAGWRVDCFLYFNEDNGFKGMLQLATGPSGESSVQYWDCTDEKRYYKSGWHGRWARTDSIHPGPSSHDMAPSFGRIVHFDYLGRESAAEYKPLHFGLAKDLDLFVGVDYAQRRISLSPMEGSESLPYGSRVYKAFMRQRHRKRSARGNYFVLFQV